MGHVSFSLVRLSFSSAICLSEARPDSFGVSLRNIKLLILLWDTWMAQLSCNGMKKNLNKDTPRTNRVETPRIKENRPEKCYLA